MKKFVKSTEIALVNGGYLSLKEGESPINNKKFVQAQKHAEYIVTFAEMAKGKDFNGKKADSLQSLEKAVKEALASKATKFVEKSERPEKPLTEKLATEAMAFMNFEASSSKVEKINKFLQQFEILHEFESHGLFFKDGIVKLNKIYTMEEIIAAVESTIDLLD